MSKWGGISCSVQAPVLLVTASYSLTYLLYMLAPQAIDPPDDAEIFACSLSAEPRVAPVAPADHEGGRGRSVSALVNRAIVSRDEGGRGRNVSSDRPPAPPASRPPAPTAPPEARDMTERGAKVQRPSLWRSPKLARMKTLIRRPPSDRLPLHSLLKVISFSRRPSHDMTLMPQIAEAGPRR